jgi:hypothetical protein
MIAAQQQPVRVTAAVDRDEVDVGGEVVLTITVYAAGNEPVQILDPPLNGLEVRSSSERSEVSVEGGEFARITTRDLRLAPTRNGIVTIGPVRAVQGTSTAETTPIQVTVVGVMGGASASILPHVLSFIEQQPPPRIAPDEVAVQILSTADTVVLGDQLDLVVLAWFPREIRTRLRTPPTLQPPQPQGAWVYEQGAPGAVALTRRVGGANFDVYAHHTVVFPLTAGEFEIGPATVSYSLPLTYSFLSREIRHEPQSEPIQIHVTPQPSAGRPAGFRGTAASDLEFTLDVEPMQLPLGSAGSVVATLSGRGNVSLWPEPSLTWPVGMRVYPENVEVEITPLDGYIAGAKRFRYLVVADSFGTHRIEPPSYEYYDLDVSQYVTLTLEPIDILTEGGPRSSFEPPARALSLAEDRESWLLAARLADALPTFIWFVIALAPPLLVAAAGATRRLGWMRGRSVRAEGTPLEAVEARFRSVLGGLVPDAEVRDGRLLSGALRAVGVDGPVAAHVVRVRDRLWQANYGPPGEIDPSELAAEVEEVLRALTGGTPGAPRKVVTACVVLALLGATAAGGATAQTAERLYETGAFRAAADSFEARAELEPWSAAHQQNLGTSLYRLGNVAGAKAAWVRAARLAPRSKDISDLLEMEQATSGADDGLLWIAPITPSEALLIAIVCWLVGWTLVGVKRRTGIVILGFAIVACGYAGIVHGRYSKSVGLVVSADTPLRWAPYGPAPVRRILERGTPVETSRVDGRWVLVTQGSRQGWLLLEEVEGI